MIIAEIDIYSMAQVFIDKHGDVALLEAMKKEEEFFLNHIDPKNHKSN